MLTSVINLTSLIPFPSEFNLVFFVHDNTSVCFNLPGEIRVQFKITWDKKRVDQGKILVYHDAVKITWTNSCFLG